MTTYLGNYLTEHYHLPDHRSDPGYASWHEDYEEYRAFQHELLREQDQLSRYLMLLVYRNYSVDLTLGDSCIFADSAYRHLLKNICIDTTYPTTALDGADLEIRVSDRDTGEAIDAVQGTFVFNNSGELIDVSLTHLGES